MTTTALALPDNQTGEALALVAPAAELVSQIANTSFVPPAYRGKPGELLAAILTGHELGLGPMTAIAKVHNIEGRASLSAEVMRALVQSKGHHIAVAESTPTKATVVGWRAGEEKPTDGSNRFTWTLDMAERAGLKGKQNWRKYPQAMLMARATGEMCRALFADCLAGISYTDEELEDGFDVEQNEALAVDADAPAAVPSSTTRKLGKRAAKKAAPKPTPPPAAEDPMADLDDIDAIADGAPVVEDATADEVEVLDAPGPRTTEEVLDERGPSLPPDRALAARYRERGLPEEHRPGFYLAVTGGAHRSGKTMGAAEVAAVFDVLNADQVEVRALGPSEWEVVVDGEPEFWFAEDEAPADGGGAVVVPLADDHQSWDQARWKAEAKAHDLSAVDVLRHLSKFRASDPTIPESDTSSLVKLAGSTSSDLKDEARRFIESGGGRS